MSVNITFLGGADTVTGSRHLVHLGGQRILLDCGMFQGWKVLRERNWAPLGVPPHTIDAVVLSHAHLDHSGWLPALVAHGWRGPVYASPATCALAAGRLMDSAHLQEEDARRANKYGYTRHEKALPLYTTADAKRAIAKITPLPAGREISLGPVHIGLTPVGHLLGRLHAAQRVLAAGAVPPRGPAPPGGGGPDSLDGPPARAGPSDLKSPRDESAPPRLLEEPFRAP